MGICRSSGQAVQSLQSIIVDEDKNNRPYVGLDSTRGVTTACCILRAALTLALSATVQSVQILNSRTEVACPCPQRLLHICFRMYECMYGMSALHDQSVLSGMAMACLPILPHCFRTRSPYSFRLCSVRVRWRFSPVSQNAMYHHDPRQEFRIAGRSYSFSDIISRTFAAKMIDLQCSTPLIF